MSKNQSTWGLWMTPLGNNFWRQCIIRYTIYYFDGVDDQKNWSKKIYNPLQISIYTLRNLHCWLLVYRFYNFAIIKIRTILQYTPHQQKKFTTADIKFSRKFIRTFKPYPLQCLNIYWRKKYIYSAIKMTTKIRTVFISKVIVNNCIEVAKMHLTKDKK